MTRFGLSPSAEAWIRYRDGGLEECTLLALCHPFGFVLCAYAQVIRVLGHNKIHRLAVVDTDDGNRVIGIITQSAVVRFLAERRDLFGQLAEIKMRRFVLAGTAKPLITVANTSNVRDALRVLLAHRISGAPVIDSDGNIVANLSVTDVRCLAKAKDDVFERALSQNVLDFLREMRSGTRSLFPLVLHPDDSFATAVQLLAAASVHRVYIVEGRKPVGVVALADVLRVIAPEPHVPAADAGSAAGAPAEEAK